MRRPSGSRYRQRSFKQQQQQPLIPQDRTPSPEVIRNTATGIAKRVVLLRPSQDLHMTPRHRAKFPPVARLLLTPGLTAPTAWLLVLNIWVVVGSIPSMSGVTKLPNNSNGPLKETRPKHLSKWPLQYLTSRSAEMSMVMVTYQHRHRAPNPLLRRRRRNLIILLHYR